MILYFLREKEYPDIRMHLRRFTRLTNALSRKLENLKAALSLHFRFYNFCRVHGSPRATQAMATGVTVTCENGIHSSPRRVIRRTTHVS